MARWIWVALVLALPSIAHGEPVRLETSGVGCELDELHSRTAAVAARDPFVPFARTAIRVDTEVAEVGLVARVWFESPGAQAHGLRTVVAESCDELVERLAVVIAMVVPEDSVAPVDADRVEPTPAPRPVHPSERVTAALVGFGVNLDEAFVSVGLHVRRGRTSIGVELRPAFADKLAIARMGSVQLRQSDAIVLGCLHHGALAACALTGVSLVQAAGDGLLRERSVASPLPIAGLRTTWEHRVIDRMRVMAYAELDAAVGRVTIDVDDMSVWRSPGVQAVGGLAALVQFP